MTPEEKARLPTWLIDQRNQGDEQPVITEKAIEYVKAKNPLPVHERADRLLRFVADQTTTVGTNHDIRRERDGLYAWSESVHEAEIGYLIDYLFKLDWVDAMPQATTVRLGDYEVPVLLRVTVQGRSHIG